MLTIPVEARQRRDPDVARRFYDARFRHGSIDGGSTQSAIVWPHSFASCRPRLAIDSRARFRLYLMRAALLRLWFAQKPSSVVHNKLRDGCTNVGNEATLAARLVCFPASWLIETCLRMLIDREWRRGHHLPGSEAYVHPLRTVARG